MTLVLGHTMLLSEVLPTGVVGVEEIEGASPETGWGGGWTAAYRREQ